MSGKRVYGTAYPISQSEAKAYRRVDRRAVRPNPIGVTAMSSVNGRGSAKSARVVAQGKTRSQRIARAESVYRNGEKPMAGVLKNKRKTSKSSTTKKSTRRKVPGTNYYKTSGGRYQDASGKYVKGTTVKATKSRKRTTAKKKSTPKKRTTAKRRTTTSSTARRRAPVRRRKTASKSPVRKTTRRKVRRNASVGASSSYSAGYDKMKRSEAAKKAAATRKRRAAAKARAQGKASSVGKYKRIRVTDPRTGKAKLSYMYETKGGKRRKIPTSAVKRSGHKSAAEIKRARSKAAARIKREGSAFVANGKTSARQKRAGKRVAAFMAAKRSGKTVAQAKRSALKKVPLQRGDTFKGTAKAPVTTSKRRTKVRRNAKGASKATPRKRVRKNRRKTKTTLRKNSVKRRQTTAKRRSTAKRRTVRKNAVRRPKRSTARRMSPNKRSVRRRKTSRRRTATRRYRKNAFMANLKSALTTGAFVFGGFLVHRIATNLIVEKALATTLPDNQPFQDWKKPMVGLGVMLLGMPAAGMIAPKRGIELGAGMAASFFQSLIVSALNAAGQPNLVSSVAGYGNSRAYALRGNRRRRRGVRGMERHAVSIMPRYTPVRGMGQYQQAAAGQFQQAAAGQFQQAAAGTGEYFTATGEYFTATGEYFAPQGMKGVGAYEPAGELAMQAAAGTNQVIRDGLRPDGDIDYALDVAEAAAGLGDVATEHRVGQQSQWIPNNPLFAGERPVTHTQATSEISAGILQRPGGNGVLSGG